MPIRNLNVAPRFPRVGTIAKGAEREQGKFPKDLEVFRLRTDDQAVQAVWDGMYPDEPPSMLIIRFPYPTVERVWDANMEIWSGGGLIHRCDGESMSVWKTPEGEYSHEPTPCPYATGERQRTAADPGCKPRGRLTFMLPYFLEIGIVGTLTLQTGSWNDIKQISSCFENVAEWGLTDLRAVPFTIYRKPQELKYVDPKGKEHKVTKSLLFMTPDADWTAAMLAQYRLRAYSLPPGAAPGPLAHGFDDMEIDDTSYFNEQAAAIEDGKGGTLVDDEGWGYSDKDDDAFDPDGIPSESERSEHGERFNHGGIPVSTTPEEVAELDKGRAAAARWEPDFWQWAEKYMRAQGSGVDAATIYASRETTKAMKGQLREYTDLSHAQHDFIIAVRAYFDAQREGEAHWLNDTATVAALVGLVSSGHASFDPAGALTRIHGRVLSLDDVLSMIYQTRVDESLIRVVPNDKAVVIQAITRWFYHWLCQELAEQTSIGYSLDTVMEYMAQRGGETNKRTLADRAGYIKEWFRSQSDGVGLAPEDAASDEIPF